MATTKTKPETTDTKDPIVLEGEVIHQEVSTPKRRSDPPNPIMHVPLIAVSILIMVGTLAHYIRIPWPFIAASALIVPPVAAISWIARHQHIRPATPPPHSETVAVAAGAVAALVWLAFVAENGVWSGWSIAALVGIALIAWPVYAALHLRRVDRSKQTPAQLAAAEKLAAVKPRNEWELRLAAAGAKHVDVLNATQTANGTWVIGIAMQPGYVLSEVANAIGKLETSMSRELQEADPKVKGIRPGSIELRTDSEAAHAASIRIPTVDVLGTTIKLADVLAANPLPAGRTFATPLRLGQETDGTHYAVNTGRAHGLISAMTNSGKTALMDSILIQRTTTVDTLANVLAGQKGERWLAAWLAPWIRGEADRPPFGWVATELEEALMMYASLYQGALWRSKQVSPDDGHDGWAISPTTPAIMTMCDESTDFLKAPEKIEVVDRHGTKNLRFCDIDLLLLRVGRSEAHQQVKATQRSTATMLGGTAGDSKSQIGFRVALKSPSSHDRSSVLSGNLLGVNLATLPPGAGYVQPPDSDDITLNKFYFPSTTDIQAAAIEAARVRPELDAGTAGAMPFWHGRWARQEDLLKTMARGATRSDVLPKHVREFLDADADAANKFSGTAETAITTPAKTGDTPPELDAAREAANADLERRIAGLANVNPLDIVNLDDVELTEEGFTAMMGVNNPDVSPVAAAILDVIDETTDWTEITPLCTAAAAKLGWEPGAESQRRVRAAIASMAIPTKRRRTGTGDNKREQAETWAIVSACKGFIS
jgi:hypothetical protein